MKELWMHPSENYDNEPDWLDDEPEPQIDHETLEENIASCPFGLNWDIDSIGNMIATPNQTFWSAWRSRKNELKDDGYIVYKDRPRFGNGPDVWWVAKKVDAVVETKTESEPEPELDKDTEDFMKSIGLA